MPRRIIGQDRNPIFQQVNQQIGTELGKQNQILAQGLQTASQTSATITQSGIDSLNATKQFAQVQAQIAASKSNRPQDNIFGQIAQGLSVFTGDSKAARQEVMQMQEQMSEYENSLATQEMLKLVSEGDEFMMEYPADNFETKGHDIIAKYPHLKPAQAANLYEKLYAKLGASNKQRAGQRAEAIKGIRDEVATEKKIRLEARLQGVLAQLELQPHNAQELMTKFDQINKQWIEENKDLSPIDIAKIQNSVLEQFVDSTRMGLDASLEIDQRLAQQQGFLGEAARIQQEYAGNQLLINQKLAEAAIRFNVASSQVDALTDPNVQLRAMLENKTLTTQLDELNQQQIRTGLNSIDLDRAFVGLQAVRYANDPIARAELESNPNWKTDKLSIATVELAKGIENYQEVKRRNSLAINGIQRTIQTLNQAHAKFIFTNSPAAYNSALQDYIGLLEEEGAAAAISELERLQAIAPTGNPDDPSFTTEQREEAKRQFLDWHRKITDTLTNRAAIFNQEAKEAGDILERYGLMGQDLNDPAFIQKLESDYILKKQEVEAVIQQSSGLTNNQPTGANVNFKFGAPDKTLVYTGGSGTKYTLPYKPGQESVTVSSLHSHADGAPRVNHAGVDIAAPLNSPVVSPVRLKITKVGWDEDGYGHYVTGQDLSTGQYHRFAHFSQKPNYSPGTTLEIGDQVGLTGSSGKSSGSHLHWEIRNNDDYGIQGSLDPLAYSAGQLENSNNNTVATQPRGDNSEYYQNTANPYTPTNNNQTATMPSRALQLIGNQYVIDNLLVDARSTETQPIVAPEGFTHNDEFTNSGLPVFTRLETGSKVFNLNGTLTKVGYQDTEVRELMQNGGANPYDINPNHKSHAPKPAAEAITTANPIVNSFTRGDKNGFEASRDNKPGNNYGYAILARNPNFSAKIAEVATDVGIPASWLSDIISLESGFDPSIQNPQGATGLIQFYPKSGTAGMTWGGETTEDLKNMTFTQQMEVVRRYLKGGEFRGKLKTVGHVAAAVFGGVSLLDLYIDNPTAALNRGDGNINLRLYIKKLGAPAGRVYQVPGSGIIQSKTQAIHTSFVVGCSVCKKLKESGSQIIPHQGAT